MRSFHNKAPEHVPESLWPALGPILEQIGSLTQRIREYDRQLETIAEERYPETDLLRQVEGVGAFTALTFVLTLEDPYRFERSRAVGAYLGLVPARDKRWDEMLGLVTDEMLGAFAVQAAPEEIGPALRERYEGLIDRVALYEPFVPGQRDDFWRTTIGSVRAAG